MAIINSVQQVTITIAANATTGTATIASVDPNTAIEQYCGHTVANTSLNPATDLADVVMTNGTTLTATRNTLDASNAIVVNVSVTQLNPSVVTSVQRGTITMTAASSATASLTFTLTNAVVFFEGMITTYTSNNPNHYLGSLALTASTVTASRGGTTNNMTMPYVLLEFAAGVLNSSTQQGATSTTGTSATATITAVTAGQTMLVYGGCKYTGGSATSDSQQGYIFLTDGSTVTVTRTATSVGTCANPFGILEFKAADIKLIQRGNIALSTAQSSNTATITAVITANCIGNYTGMNCTGPSTNDNSRKNCTLVLTNTTTFTLTRTNTVTVAVADGYEAIEFIPLIVVFPGTESYFYPRINKNYIYPSVFEVPHIPAFFNKFFADALHGAPFVYPYRRPDFWWTRVQPVYQSNPATIKILYGDAWEILAHVYPYRRPNFWWAQLPENYEANPANIGIFYAGALEFPAYVYPYRKPFNAWVNVKPVYESNPANIGIFYAGAWEILAHVYPYVRPNYWWTQLPEKYEANPATIKILYADAWEVNNQVRYYPAKNYNTILAQSVMQPELATIGLIFSAAFTTQLMAPTRRPLNLNFLAQNPVIDIIAALPGLGEYIITLRRRRR